MPFFALAVVLGVVAGWFAGGRLRAIRARPLRLPLLPLAAAGLYAVRFVTLDGAPRVSDAFLIGSLGLVALWIAANAIGRPRVLRLGVLTITAGWLLNAVATVGRAGADRFRDVVSVDALSLHLSAGDLVLALGLVMTIAASMRRPGMTASSNRPFRRTKADVFVKGS